MDVVGDEHIEVARGTEIKGREKKERKYRAATQAG